MAKLNGLKLSQGEVSQTIDLKDVFGVPIVANDQLAEAIGQAMIDKIVKRTESGIDVDGKAFKKYSKEYKDSLAFKAFGKDGSVNLRLTGQMLDTLDVKDIKASKIKIGWDDSIENAKAFNHNTGDTLPKRQFFGITDKELAEIKDEFKDRVVEASTSLKDETAKIKDVILRSLKNTDRIKVDNNDGG